MDALALAQEIVDGRRITRWICVLSSTAAAAAVRRIVSIVHSPLTITRIVKFMIFCRKKKLWKPVR